MTLIKWYANKYWTWERESLHFDEHHVLFLLVRHFFTEYPFRRYNMSLNETTVHTGQHYILTRACAPYLNDTDIFL